MRRPRLRSRRARRPQRWEAEAGLPLEELPARWADHPPGRWAQVAHHPARAPGPAQALRLPAQWAVSPRRRSRKKKRPRNRFTIIIRRSITTTITRAPAQAAPVARWAVKRVRRRRQVSSKPRRPVRPEAWADRLVAAWVARPAAVAWAGRQAAAWAVRPAAAPEAAAPAERHRTS